VTRVIEAQVCGDSTDTRGPITRSLGDDLVVEAATDAVPLLSGPTNRRRRDEAGSLYESPVQGVAGGTNNRREDCD
jgi:hypothetical protein